MVMDVEQNRSNENHQVLAVFDGLLPMVCYSLLSAVILCFAYNVLIFLDEHFSAIILLIFNIFQDYEGDVKPSVNPSYIRNEMKGNLNSRGSVNAMISFVLKISANYFRSLRVFTFILYCTAFDNV